VIRCTRAPVVRISATKVVPWLAVRSTVIAGLVASVVVASSTSHATPTGRGEPRLRDRTIAGTPPVRTPRAFGRLAAQGWRATWDRDTGVPARMWGGVVPAPGTTHDAALAEAAARGFLARHVELLAPGARASDFVAIANRLDGEVRTVTFAQTWRGVRVVGGHTSFVFGNDRLFAIGSSAWPDVDATLPMVRELRGERAILPRVHGGAIAYHDVDIIDEETVRVYLDASGRELARQPRVARATATLAYNVPVRHPGGARHDVPAPAASILVDGTATTTASNGSFSWPGTTPSTVVPSVTGTFVRVVDEAGTAATGSLAAQPSQSVVWNVASDELADAQVSAYIYANLAKAKARLVNPAVSEWLDARLDVIVNKNGSCQAFSTGDDLHFYRKNAQCENTARLADVVFHELGHSLHAQSVIPGMGDFDHHLSEGLADFFAASMTGDTAVGRGFFLDDAPLREIDPVGSERVYPADFDFDPHVSGLIIAGALWDLRKALIKQLGPAAGIARTDKILAGIMQRADDIGTTFVAALIADDNDGDLGNNTPNYCAIERAFGAHGLVPDFATTRVSPPVIDERELAMIVDTPATAMCTPPTVVAIKVTWRVGDGVASSFDLVPDGGEGGAWRGSFPEQPSGSVISYAIDVIYDDGGVQVFPNNPADPRYQLFVGSAAPIYCEPFDVDPQWEQSSNRGFEWQWGPPVVGLAGHDPPAAKTGTNVLGTDLSGDGRYRSNLVVSITTPVIDVSKYQLVHLQYWRWLTVEDALYDQATIRANGHEVWRNAGSVATGTLDHVDREWRFHDIDLTPHIDGGTVQVAWALSADFGKELGGWTLDDVCIVGLHANPRCGDGALDDGEECDDGNQTDGDGCDRRCREEPVAGGGCTAANASPTTLLALLALLGRRRRRR
jgi:cysteine-rich repeat protein